MNKCRVCGYVAKCGYCHLKAWDLDPDHAVALSRTSWRMLLENEEGNEEHES